MRAKILDKAEKKRIFEELKARFGFEGKLDYGFLKLHSKVKVLSKDFKDVSLEGLTIENLGLLFGEWLEGRLKLSVEGSQIVGPHATRNVLELDGEQLREWMTGGVLKPEEPGLEEGFVILKHGQDFVGCGKLSKGRIWSSIPPHRRIKQT